MEWTEKYRPESLSEVRGNNKSVKELKDWAETWDDHRKPAILHGEPGVGKTSSAHALANDKGWEVTELNASNQRTSSVVERVAGEASKSRSLTASRNQNGRRLIILDEADNLHGNADRGGSRAVTDIVKSSRQPVVLIANDLYEMSRSLRNYCEKVEFRDVSSRSIVPVLRDICKKEGIEYDKAALKKIANANSGDLRGAINDLQAVAEGRDFLNEEDVSAGSRDTTEDIFEFLDTVFQGDDLRKAMRQARDVDESPDDLVHWIDENLPKAYEGDEIAEGYRNLARADVYLGRTVATQNYSLWKYANDLMVGGVNTSKKGSKGGWTRYSPPSTFSRLGRTRKKRETRDSLARKIGESSTVSISSGRGFVPYLRLLFEDISTAAEMASELDLSEDEIEFVVGSEKKAEEIAERAEEPDVVEENVENQTDEDGVGAGEENEDEDETSQSTLSNF
ncbi:MAG: replication factor C large subunit [Halobacteria archaeon]|nr:replication factor C large subunit [Halobacteria archaeon]